MKNHQFVSVLNNGISRLDDDQVDQVDRLIQESEAIKLVESEFKFSTYGFAIICFNDEFQFVAMANEGTHLEGEATLFE